MAQKFIGVTLPIRLGQTGMFEQSTDTIQQVRSNFRNLILTKKGERVQQPDFGCDIWNILFEPFTEDTLENARLSVVSAVDRWLPFLELINFEIIPTNKTNLISILCLYRFRGNPNVNDLVLIENINTETATVLQSGMPSNSTEDTLSQEDILNEKFRERSRLVRRL
jgi:phage baseplate assembly protein W